MNDTKSYILEMRGVLIERLAARALLYLLVSSVFCGLSYTAVTLVAPDLDSAFVSPITEGCGTLEVARYLLCCTFPAAVSLLVVYAAAHTVMSHVIGMTVLCVRGLVLGCIGGLIGMGAEVGVHCSLALTLYFLATVLIIVLAALSDIFSKCLCRVYADPVPSLARELFFEYLRVFSVLAGGVFVLTALCSAALQYGI